MNGRSRIIICIAVVLLAIGVAAYFQTSKKQIKPAQDKFVFLLNDLENNPVTSIYLQSGNTGDYRTFSSTEDIDWFVSRLKKLTYVETREVEPFGGWTYRLIINQKVGSISRTLGPDYILKTTGGQFFAYYLTEDSVSIMEEIIALMPQ